MSKSKPQSVNLNFYFDPLPLWTEVQAKEIEYIMKERPGKLIICKYQPTIRETVDRKRYVTDLDFLAFYSKGLYNLSKTIADNIKTSNIYYIPKGNFTVPKIEEKIKLFLDASNKNDNYTVFLWQQTYLPTTEKHIIATLFEKMKRSSYSVSVPGTAERRDVFDNIQYMECNKFRRPIYHALYLFLEEILADTEKTITFSDFYQRLREFNPRGPFLASTIDALDTEDKALLYRLYNSF